MNAGVLTSYERAEAYLLSTIDERTSPRTSYKLDRMRALLRELGDPHLAYPTVHVGGTSGKGSTCTMIAAALQASGKRTGLHTKPHLSSMTERAKIDGVPISPRAFAALLVAMMPSIETVTLAFGRPTYYETLLALALLAFARARVDVAVVEVGLGGRLDGTNVLQPQVAAITSIGFDHTDVLGDTLEAIAGEKAGIAKPGVPLVLANVPPQAEAVVAAHASAADAPLVRVRDVAAIERSDADPPERFDVVTERARYRIVLPVYGSFQRTNAATAIAVLERLGDDLRPSVEAIERGLAAVDMPGRMEVRGERPAIVFDIAHNADKAAGLASSLRERFPTAAPVRFVVAIGESKDAGAVIAALASASPQASFSFTAFPETGGRRAIAPETLAELARERGLLASIEADPREALAAAVRDAGPDGLVVVTGSTFLVALLRACTATAAE